MKLCVTPSIGGRTMPRAVWTSARPIRHLATRTQVWKAWISQRASGKSGTESYAPNSAIGRRSHQNVDFVVVYFDIKRLLADGGC